MKRIALGPLAAGTLLGSWLILTALHQVKFFRSYTSRLDKQSAFLPIWTFFGPIPGTLDSEILVRHTDADGVGEWKHLKVYEPRRWSHMILHTNRRLEKTMFDAVGDVNRQLGEGEPPERISGSFSYIVLLGIVMARTTHAGATHVQFMVVNTSGSDSNAHSLVPVFASAVHSA